MIARPWKHSASLVALLILGTGTPVAAAYLQRLANGSLAVRKPTSDSTQLTNLPRGNPKMLQAREGQLRITVLYDNYSHDPRMQTGWGFAALIEYRDRTILFDTGADAPTLLANMRALAIDPRRIEAVALSHAHGDHTGGLAGLLEAGARPAVHLLPSFPSSFIRQIQATVTVTEVTLGQQIGEGVFTTGEVSGTIPEQALIVDTELGLVLVTGCAHPGVLEMIERASALRGKKVNLVLGGFHLRGKSTAELQAIVAAFRRLGVEKVAPCHCTGDPAIQMFRDEYLDNFVPVGVGRIVVVGSGEESGRLQLRS
ncbi:MAG: MBL fold metallo-hydrolase [Gemmatimonadota bacterium]|nr:MAG: MBL fold metallo-hydrolase [Gemmatimonadota bacterium]